MSLSSSFLGSPPMKRLLLLTIGCSACLLAGATTGAEAADSNKATINAKGEVPSACFVNGNSLGLGLEGRNKLSAIGTAEMQSSGPASFALDPVSIKAPDFALKGGLSAQVLISSSLGNLVATDDSSGKLDLKEPLSDKSVETSVSVSSRTGVLAAGNYELSTTLTCVSN